MRRISIYLFSLLCLVSISVSAQNYYEVKDFVGVTTSETIKAEITIGDKFSVELKGDEDAIEQLIVELRGKMLVIRPKVNLKSWQRTYPDANVIAYITMPSIKTLISSGSGGIEVKGVNKTDALTLTISGSARMTLQNESKNTTVILSGRGDCNIKGHSTKMTVTLTGSGKINASDYIIQDLSAVLSGGGKVYTHTQNYIKAVISGAAMVYYKGDPDVKATTLMGSGKVQAMDETP